MFAVFALLSAMGATCEQNSEDILLSGVVSTDTAHEGLDWISKDGAQVLFTRASPNFSESTLMQARKGQTAWAISSLPISIGPVDAGLSIAPDRKSALFTSTRRGTVIVEGDWNIWRANASHKEGEWSFSDVTALPTPVNSTHSECCVVHGAGGEFYFSSDRGGSWDIYRADPVDDGYRVALLPGAINTSDGAWPSAYDGKKGALIFSSIRKSGAGGDDIYISYERNGEWSAGKMLGPRINRPGYEDGARQFHGAFFWSSRPADAVSLVDLNVSNIYTMPTACIDELG